jgi:hypothetical protein
LRQLLFVCKQMFAFAPLFVDNALKLLFRFYLSTYIFYLWYNLKTLHSGSVHKTLEEVFYNGKRRSIEGVPPLSSAHPC